ncbi:MAG: rhodanese-related sulfurtransferase [Parachlamydiaceae bacterium]
MSLDHPYFVLAYYAFNPISNPAQEIKEHKDYLGALDAKSRIYISEEGINGQMSASKEDALRYIDWLRSKPPFKDIDVKIHGWHEQAFPKLTIKYRKNLVARNQEVDLSLRGEHMPAEEFKKLLDQDADNYLLIDVRNNYEWKVGHFKNAELPPCNNYREFENYAAELKNRLTESDKEKKVVMYCTGGIRCELYSSLLMKHGIKNVFQLEGGVIKYGLEQGSKHWQGKLFVFDDRLTVPISEEETPIVGTCHFCNCSSDNYYNCANMDCNELFLCCPSCLEQHSGCCQDSCQHSSRLRPYHHQHPHKPFRKAYTYFKNGT